MAFCCLLHPHLPYPLFKYKANPNRGRFVAHNPQHTPLTLQKHNVLEAGSVLAAPLASSYVSSWQIWSAILAGSALGVWSEETKIGKELSGALVATLLGLTMSNLGILPFTAPAYDTVNKFLLPLAIPMLLYSADLRRVIRDTGKLLMGFGIGTIGTIVGTLIAFAVFPLRGIEDGWKVASALCGRHIGGAVNFVGVGEALGISSSTATAALAADNVLCILYFATLYWLAKDIDPEESGRPESSHSAHKQGRLQGIDLRTGFTGMTLSAIICFAGGYVAEFYGMVGAVIPIITAITVCLATAFPKALEPLLPSCEGIATLLMHVFFCVIGATGSLQAVISQAPVLFGFCFVQIAVHLVFLLAVGKLAKIEKRDLLVASNANVGGPTTAAGMCATKGWSSAVVPAVLIGTLGYSIATFLAISLGFGMADAQKTPDNISPKMTSVLSVYSLLFMRFAWRVEPRNYLLLACHFSNETVQLYNLQRWYMWYNTEGKALEEQARIEPKPQ